MTISHWLIVLSILAPYSHASAARTEPLEPVVEALRTALNEHRFDAIEAHLDPDFAFAGQRGEMGLTILRQVVAGYPRTIESFEMEELSVSEGRRTARVRFRLDGGEVESHELHLSEQGLLLKADVVQIQLAGHGSMPGPRRPAPLAGESIPTRMTVPFQLHDRLIVVDAEVEGVRGKFMVDTGAQDALSLNSSLFPELAARSSAMGDSPHGANGEIHDVVQTEASGFRWQELELDTVSATLWNMDHLAEAAEIDHLVGLIGYGLLERFLIEFDYDARRLVLTRLEADGTPVEKIAPAGHTFQAEMMFHVPVVEVQLGGQTLRLAIDSGAEQGMIQTRWSGTLEGGYTELGMSEMTGADKNTQTGMEVRFDELAIGDLAYEDMPFRFNDLQFGHAVEIDGLLGQPFLSRFRTALNLRTGEVLVWDESVL